MSLKLFRVEVTRKWSATMEALVWASNKNEAGNAARGKEDFTTIDALNDGVEVKVGEADIDILEKLQQQPNEVLIIPAPIRSGPFPPRFEVVDTLSEFIAHIDDDLARKLRTKAIERNNGQLPLLEQAA
jgi:hypothetical protein